MSLELKSELLFELEATIDPTDVIGPTPKGMRIVGNVSGGTVSGPRISGKLLPSGGDWLLVRADGCMDIDVRATIETDDGALIYASYLGRWYNPEDVAAQMADPETAAQVDPTRYYFRTLPLFETSAEKYAWLNRIVGVGVGRRTKTGVAYKVYEIK